MPPRYRQHRHSAEELPVRPCVVYALLWAAVRLCGVFGAKRWRC